MVWQKKLKKKKGDRFECRVTRNLSAFHFGHAGHSFGSPGLDKAPADLAAWGASNVQIYVNLLWAL